MIVVLLRDSRGAAPGADREASLLGLPGLGRLLPLCITLPFPGAPTLVAASVFRILLGLPGRVLCSAFHFAAGLVGNTLLLCELPRQPSIAVDDTLLLVPASLLALLGVSAQTLLQSRGDRASYRLVRLRLSGAIVLGFQGSAIADVVIACGGSLTRLKARRVVMAAGCLPSRRLAAEWCCRVTAAGR